MRRSALFLTVVALTAAACGGGSSHSTSSTAAAGTTPTGGSSTSSSTASGPTAVLGSIKTQTGPQKVNLTMGIKLNGVPASAGAAGALLQGPITITANGAGDSASKTADVTFTIAAGALNLNARIITNGTKSWIEYQNNWYTLDSSALSGLPGASTGATPTTTTPPIDVTKVQQAFSNPSRFLKNAQVVGTESVSGIDSTHLTGQVDVAGLFATLAQLGASSAAQSSGLSGLTGGTSLQQIGKAFKTATVDIWVGNSDHAVHRIAAHIVLDASGLPQSSSTSGFKGADLTVDGTILPTSPVSITPPANAKPSSALGQALLGSLAPALGGGGLSIPTTT
jgi:hypothetical protein